MFDIGDRRGFFERCAGSCTLKNAGPSGQVDVLVFPGFHVGIDHDE